MNLRLVVLERSIGDRADLSGLLLVQSGVLRWQHGANGADDRAGSIGDGFLVVGVLESRALGCIPGVSTFSGYWGAGVAVDDVVVVLDLCVGDGTAGLRVVREGGVAGWEDRGGRSDDGADGGHVCGLCLRVMKFRDLFAGWQWDGGR